MTTIVFFSASDVPTGFWGNFGEIGEIFGWHWGNLVLGKSGEEKRKEKGGRKERRKKEEAKGRKEERKGSKP